MTPTFLVNDVTSFCPESFKVNEGGGGGNSSLVVFVLTVYSVAGSILLWGNFLVEGIFSLGVNMGSNSIPPKTLSDESIN